MFFHHHTEQLKSEADHVSLQIKISQGLVKEHRDLHELTRPLLFSLTSASPLHSMQGPWHILYYSLLSNLEHPYFIFQDSS